MFHQMPGVSADDVKSGKCREFAGTGTPHLRVAGLVGEPTRVRVDMIDLPARLSMRFPDNHLNGQTIAGDMPLLRVEADSDGTPVILRSMISNDGVWQKGHKIYVWGDWDDAAEAPTPSVVPAIAPANQDSKPDVDTKPTFDPAEKLSKASLAQLTALAKEAGIEPAPSATKADLIAQILIKKAELDAAKQETEKGSDAQD